MKTIRLLHKTIGVGLNVASLLAPRAAAKRALSLFATPPRPRLRPKEAEFLAGAQREELMLAGRPIAVYHWGPATGPVALLSYGWAYNAGRWRHFVPGLVEAGFRVIAYDPPGHGYSPHGEVALPLNASLIAELMLYFGRPEVVIAHSFGGASTIYALQQLPPAQRPRRAVIMASFSQPSEVFRSFQRTLSLHEMAYWRFVRHVEQLMGVSLRNMDLARLTAHLADVQGLVVHDRHDEVTHFRHARRYHAYWPGCALWATEGKGHHLGDPEITRAIVAFATRGQLPDQAERRQQPLPANHDLVRYFAGWED
jgi:pimeloyl-ACP methyl ester carboxylesterase